MVIKRGSVRVQIYPQKWVVAGAEYFKHVVAWVDATGKRVRKAFSDLAVATALAEQTVTALSPRRRGRQHLHRHRCVLSATV